MKENKRKGDTGKGSGAFYNTLFFTKEIDGLSVKSARPFLSGPIPNFINGLARSVAYSSTRTYGWCVFTFGILSLIMHLAEYYFSSEPAAELSTLIIAAAFAIFGIPLILFDKPMCIALQELPITSYIFFDFFSIKKMRRNENVKPLPHIVGVLVGIIPAVLAFFFGMEYVCIGILALIIVVLSFVSAEFPFLFMLLALPYLSVIPHSDVVLVCLSLFSLLSFARKVFLGKRVYSFGMSDILILLLAVVIVGTGVIGGGESSTLNALILIALTLTYIPAANIIVNRRLADCAINAVIISVVPIAVVAIVRYILSWVGGERVAQSSLASSPEALAAWLGIAFAFAIYALRHMKSYISLGIYVAFLVLFALAIFTTECAPVLIILISGFLAYLIIANHSLPNELLIFPFALPVCVFLLPLDVLAAVSSFFDLPLTLGEMRGELFQSLNLLLDNLFFGIGANAFTKSPEYPHFNTPLGIGIRFGVVAMVIFALLFVLRTRQTSVYSRCLRISSVRSFSTATMVALFALVSFGWFYDVFSEMSLYCLFFVLLGMNTSALQIAKDEYDGRLELYDDKRSMESSALDITISG